MLKYYKAWAMAPTTSQEQPREGCDPGQWMEYTGLIMRADHGRVTSIEIPA